MMTVMSLRDWSVRRVFFLSATWIVVTIGCFAGWAAHVAAVQVQGGGAADTVSFRIPEILILVLAPPFFFLSRWYLLRGSTRG
jgi:hypothetical protein